MATTQAWTRNQILDEANRRSFDLTDRKITDWIEKGLLARPRRRSAGRGSKLAVWSDDQVQLLWAVLHQHRAHARLATLAEVPVGAWLAWGEERVSLHQLRRAMRTWAGAHAGTHLARTRHGVRLLLDDLGIVRPPKALKDTLTELLIAITPDQHQLNRVAIDTELRAALNTGRTGLAPPQVAAYLQVLEARIEGLAPFALESDDADFPDATLQRVRVLHAQTHPGFADLAGLTQAQLHQAYFHNACRTVAMMCGFSRTSQHPDWTTP